MQHDKQNVTVTLPRDLLRELRHQAVNEGTSLSGLIARLLENSLRPNASYQQARNRQLALLEGGFPLGFEGKVPWSREQLHER